MRMVLSFFNANGTDVIFVQQPEESVAIVRFKATDLGLAVLGSICYAPIHLSS